MKRTISLLLSLCLRYSPEYLNIILIDYKGGGIKDSLSYNSKSLPDPNPKYTTMDNFLRYHEFKGKIIKASNSTFNFLEMDNASRQSRKLLRGLGKETAANWKEKPEIKKFFKKLFAILLYILKKQDI